MDFFPIYKSLSKVFRELLTLQKFLYILIDFSEVNLLWCAHQMHHSSEDYNMTTALRQSVGQKYFKVQKIFFETFNET